MRIIGKYHILTLAAAARFSSIEAFTAHHSVRPIAFHTKSTSLKMSSSGDRFTIPDQPARYARAKEENNQRYLDITTAYDPAYIKGKRVAITGANRGIGLSLSKEVTKQGAKLVAIVRSSSDELDALEPDEIITGIEATSDEACASIPDKVTGGPIDIVSFEEIVFVK